MPSFHGSDLISPTHPNWSSKLDLTCQECLSGCLFESNVQNAEPHSRRRDVLLLLCRRSLSINKLSVSCPSFFVALRGVEYLQCRSLQQQRFFSFSFFLLFLQDQLCHVPSARRYAMNVEIAVHQVILLLNRRRYVFPLDERTTSTTSMTTRVDSELLMHHFKVIVTKTEPCHHGCDEHTTPDVLTKTISEHVCRRPSTTKSITPFTSGTHTYLMSSCHPITMWHNATEECMPHTLTEVSTSTSISTRVVYHNGTVVQPIQTVTAVGNASTIRLTSVVTSPTTEYITETSYASGKEPVCAVCSSCGQRMHILQLHAPSSSHDREGTLYHYSKLRNKLQPYNARQCDV